jgi:hypothetical protein
MAFADEAMRSARRLFAAHAHDVQAGRSTGGADASEGQSAAARSDIIGVRDDAR